MPALPRSRAWQQTVRMPEASHDQAPSTANSEPLHSSPVARQTSTGPTASDAESQTTSFVSSRAAEMTSAGTQTSPQSDTENTDVEVPKSTATAETETPIRNVQSEIKNISPTAQDPDANFAHTPSDSPGTQYHSVSEGSHSAPTTPTSPATEAAGIEYVTSLSMQQYSERLIAYELGTMRYLNCGLQTFAQLKQRTAAMSDGTWTEQQAMAWNASIMGIWTRFCELYKWDNVLHALGHNVLQLAHIMVTRCWYDPEKTGSTRPLNSLQVTQPVCTFSCPCAFTLALFHVCRQSFAQGI